MNSVPPLRGGGGLLVQKLSGTTLRWHRIVHGNERHRLTADRASTKVERSDIDPGRPERRPELTDETRRVVIDNVEHVTGEVGLDGNAENIDKARGAVAE
jgi:hypothetical protein